MTPVKLKSIRLANAVKCGPEEQDYIDAVYNGHHHFDLEVNGIYIRIECQKTKQVSWTTIYNMIYAVCEEGQRLDGASNNEAQKQSKPKAQGNNSPKTINF